MPILLTCMVHLMLINGPTTLSLEGIELDGSDSQYSKVDFTAALQHRHMAIRGPTVLWVDTNRCLYSRRTAKQFNSVKSKLTEAERRAFKAYSRLTMDQLIALHVPKVAKNR